MSHNYFVHVHVLVICIYDKKDFLILFVHCSCKCLPMMLWMYTMQGNYSEHDQTHWTPELRRALKFDQTQALEVDNGKIIMMTYNTRLVHSSYIITCVRISHSNYVNYVNPM